MNEIQKNDKIFGFNSEQEIHSILEEQFGKLLRTELNPEMGKYYEFDKYNEDYFIEVKTRRINHNKYPSLFFGKNKLIKGDEMLKKCPLLRIFYLWQCNDGCYGWEHKSSEYTIERRGRWDRGREEIDDCIDIKQKNIKPLKNLLDI
mgnify:CR=1 FL=1|tara:strand:+ start:2662 stop:3102 length:441 start_codon:yes stop_codon:yes gene_type:complete